MMRQEIQKTVLALAMLGIAVGVSPASAQDSARIAVIDVQKVYEESTRGKALMSELRTLVERKKAEGEAKGQQIQALQKQIAEGRLSLSEDRLEEMQKELEEKVIALRRFEDDTSRELQKAQTQSSTKVNNEVLPLINKLAAEQGYTLIFRKFESGLIFATEEVDITDLVIQRYNAIAGG